MREKTLIEVVGLAALCLCFTGCKDTKALQDNQQLKAQVAELQKENGQLGNDVETLTAARDELTKENSALQAEVKKKRPAAKAESRKRRRGRKSQQS